MFAEETDRASLLAPGDGPPVAVTEADGPAPLVLACEHASNRLPAALGTLGLSAGALESHIAWDPGALVVASRIARSFGAPLVAARFSRLAYDVNRPPNRADAVTPLSETTPVPGNAGLDAAARRVRAAALHDPFHAALDRVLDDTHRAAALVTVHSFTPVYRGVRRTVALGLLHDRDNRLARAMLARAQALTGLAAALNEPYGPGDGVTHTLRRHAVGAGIPNVMIEIRSDLIADAPAQDRVAAGLAALIREGLLTLARGG